jgi:hypothetical protein
MQVESVNEYRGAVVKSYGAERLYCMSIVKLNASEPLKTCRNRTDGVETVGRDSLTGARCNKEPVNWLHDIRHGDGRITIQAYIWNTGGCCNDVPKAQQEFRKKKSRKTVQQRFYSSYCCSILTKGQEMHYRASDAFIVAKTVVETQQERRDAVIQLKLF